MPDRADRECVIDCCSITFSPIASIGAITSTKRWQPQRDIDAGDDPMSFASGCVKRARPSRSGAALRRHERKFENVCRCWTPRCCGPAAAIFCRWRSGLVSSAMVNSDSTNCGTKRKTRPSWPRPVMAEQNAHRLVDQDGVWFDDADVNRTGEKAWKARSDCPTSTTGNMWSRRHSLEGGRDRDVSNARLSTRNRSPRRLSVTRREFAADTGPGSLTSPIGR